MIRLSIKPNLQSEQVAVFSEVYYDKGWDAYVDGKKTPYAKVNYVLRGMMVPAVNIQLNSGLNTRAYYRLENYRCS
jgi:uncharacterized membrane protein YfhO